MTLSRATGASAVFESLEQRRLLAFDDLGDNLAAQLSDLQGDLHSALNAASKVPLLNQELGSASALDLFPTSVLDQIKSSLNGQTDAAQIEQAIFSLLGPGGSGANVLGSQSGDGPATSIADVDATVSGSNVSIAFELYRQRDNQTFSAAFGIGLPGIPLNITSTGGMGIDVELTNTGVSFLYTEGGSGSLTPGDFGVEVDAFVDPNSSLTGTFGFFEVTAKDLNGNTSFAGTFNVTGLGTGSESVGLTGQADVDLHLILGAGPAFPSLQADFGVGWLFNDGTTRGSEPTVALSNVGIGLGTFFTSIMKPMLQNIQTFTEPHQPVIDILKARIPGLSDGTNALGLGDVSLLSLMRTLSPNLSPDVQSYINLATILIETTDIINRTDLSGTDAFINFGGFDLNTHNDDLRDLSDVVYSNIGNHRTNLTSLSPGPGTGFDLQDVIAQVKQKVEDGDLPASIEEGLVKAFDKLGNRAHYEFPILDDPVNCAFKLLLGQDVDLALFEVQFKQDAGFDQNTPYSLFGYGIDLTGTVNVDAYFKTAYDTLGLRQFLGTLVGGSADPLKLLNGLYIDEDTHLTIGGKIEAKLDVPGGIVGVNVSGGVHTPPGDPLSLTIHDPDTDGLGDDGKLRPFTGEMNDDCVIHADGELLASFNVSVRVGVTVPDPLDPFGGEIFIGIEKDLAGGSHNMINFGPVSGGPECLAAGDSTVPPPPILAGIVGDGQLQLYIGPNAHKRQNVGSNTDVAESYTVAHLEGAAGDEKLSVTAFGVTQTFEHVKSVWGDGGNENDVVMIEAGVLAPATLLGGNGDDALSHNGPGRAEIRGWAGNDTLTGGAGNDSLYGEDGDDRLNAGAGNNHVEGNAGKDQIFAGGGNDSLFGGTENDSIYAGGGDDSIQGNEGDDYVESGAGADSILGGDGKDTINAGTGNDTIRGENDNDTLIGDGGDDLIFGGAGGELIAGDDMSFAGNNSGSLGAGGGHDTIFGETGDDIVFAQGGNDYVEGNAGPDGIFGGDGHDSIWGHEGDDFLFGDAGDDDIIGGDGADAILGGDGADVILGDNGTITPTGQGHTVALASNAATDGNDTVNGGPGADSIYGQGGNDQLAGSADDDYIEGNQGDDTISGGDGEDDLVGGSSVAGTADGADFIQGFAGHDVMAGDNAQITRLVDGTSYARYVTTGMQNNAVVRSVTLLDLDSIGADDDMSGGDGDDTMHGQLGNDSMFGNDGHDDMIGHFGADYMNGGAGDDGIVGDKGTIVGEVLDGSTQRTISSQDSLLVAVINAAGTRRRLVTLIDHSQGSGDTLLGGLDNDYVHGGAGADLIEGDDPALAGGGNDALFGNLGNDVINGGAASDHLYGGSGNDSLNGGLGADTSYGGDGDDSLWADVEADRLVDWFGNFNNFYVPGNSYGVPIIIRTATSAAEQFLLDLATADGSWDPNAELVVVSPPSGNNTGKGGRSK